MGFTGSDKISQSIFKNKNFLLLFIGAFVSNIGNMLYNFAISLYILDVTENNAFIAGIYMATGGMVYAIIAPFGGAIVDKLDRVKVIYVTDFIRGITILIAGYLLFINISKSLQIPMLFVVTIILSINNALFEPASAALPANILEKDQLQQSNSVIQGSNALYNIIGVFFGAALYEIFGIQMVFIVNGLTFIFSAISELFITTKTLNEEKPLLNIKTVTKDIGMGFKYLYKLKPVFNLMILVMSINFFLMPLVINGMPYLFKVQLNTSSFYYSIIMAVFSIGIIISSIILGIKKQSNKIFKLLQIGFLGMSLFLVMFSLAIGFHVVGNTSFVFFIVSIIVFSTLIGVSNGFINIPAMTSLQVNVDKDVQGRIFSVINVLSMGLTPISIAMAGIVIQKFSLMTLFYLCTIIILILCIIGVRNKYVKQL